MHDEWLTRGDGLQQVTFPTSDLLHHSLNYSVILAERTQGSVIIDSKWLLKPLCPGPDLICFLTPSRHRNRFWKMGSFSLVYTHRHKTSSQTSNPRSFFSSDSPLRWSFQNTDLVTPFPPPSTPALPPESLQLNPKLPLYKSSSVSSIQRGTSGLNSSGRIGNRETVWSCVEVEWWRGGRLEVEGERWIS